MTDNRYVIKFPLPKSTLGFNIKEWIEEILAFVYRIYGCEPSSYYNIKDLTLTVWFDYNKQEDITECLTTK